MTIELTPKERAAIVWGLSVAKTEEQEYLKNYGKNINSRLRGDIEKAIAEYDALITKMLDV